MKRNILLNPGPSTTTQSVKNSLIVPDMCHREQEFKNLMKSIRNDLTKIVANNDDYTTILFCGSGSAAMEATMTSVMSDIRIALILVNGIYGDRFSKMARIHNIAAIRVASSYGKSLDLKKLDEMLEKDPFIKAVFVVHHETTTGILNPIEEISKIVKKHHRLLVVDAISSFAGIPISSRSCNFDFLISTSNKCLQGMAGVSFVICKKSELENCKYNNRSLYLNMYKQYRYLEDKGEMQFTAPVQVMNALRQAIDEFNKEGAENRFMRYRNNWRLLLNGMKARNIKRFLTENERHSNILETFYLPEGIDFKTFHDKLYEKNIIISPGLVGENTFRTAIIGDLHEDDIKYFLKCVDEVIS